MTRAQTYKVQGPTASFSRLKDYQMLIKMRLTSLVVFTAIASFLVASELQFTWIQLGLLAIGGFGVAGASNALNQVLEKDFDVLMKRTMVRPVASGRMTTSHAVLFAGALCLMGITALAMFNVWASFLGMLAFVTYAFVYTPLKRHSSAAIFVGAVAGAMPMAIGVVAYTNGITILALALFAIQFAWQYPHFWAIGYLGKEDYQNAGFRFIPMNGDLPSKGIAVSSIFYSTALIGLGVLMYYIGLTGIKAFMAMSIIGIVYLIYAIGFYKKFDRVSAQRLMLSSLLYIPVVMFILILDKL